MPNLDAAAGVTRSELNTLLEQYFNQAPAGNNPFKGSTQKDVQPIGAVTLNWSVGFAPTLGFGVPSQVAWDAALDSNGKTNGTAKNPLPTLPMVALTLPTLTASYVVGSQPPVGGTASNVIGYATLAFGSGTVTVTMVALSIDESGFTAWDQVIFNDFFVPKIFEAVGQMLGVVHVPTISWKGVTLNPVQIQLNGTQLIAAATLASNTVPLDTTGVVWPTDPAFLIASNGLLNAAIAAGVKPFIGHPFSDAGDFKGLANWSYSGSVSGLTATVKTVKPLVVDAELTTSLSAQATLTAAGMALAAVGCALGAAIL